MRHHQKLILRANSGPVVLVEHIIRHCPLAVTSSKGVLPCTACQAVCLDILIRQLLYYMALVYVRDCHGDSSLGHSSDCINLH